MKLSHCRLVPALATVLFLTGCVNSIVLPGGLAPVVPAQAGLPESRSVELTIYRPKKFAGSALKPTVRMNGQDLVSIRSGKIFRTRLAPGRYAFDVDGHTSGAVLDAKPGEKYYFLVGIEAGFFAGNGVLTLVAPQQGAFESQSLTPVDKDNIDAPAFR